MAGFNRTLLGIGGAIVFHGALALAIGTVKVTPRKHHAVEVEVRRKEPPPVAAVEPPPPEPPKPEPPKPEPPKPEVKAKKAEPPKAPIPNKAEPPKEPPKERPKPVFGVNMDSTTTGESGISVPVGNTTVADPNAPRPKGPVQPLAPAPPQAQPAPVFKPATDAEIASEPDFDADSCNADYPDGEAKDQGIEGETILSVEIDENGKVHGVKVLKAIGHGLDELAKKLMWNKCKFKPARNKSGQAVAYRITHHFTWELNR